jgi:hypothetical protein
LVVAANVYPEGVATVAFVPRDWQTRTSTSPLARPAGSPIEPVVVELASTNVPDER